MPLRPWQLQEDPSDEAPKSSADDHLSEQKQCTICEQYLPKDEFTPNQWKKDEQTRKCKVCNEVNEHMRSMVALVHKHQRLIVATENSLCTSLGESFESIAQCKNIMAVLESIVTHAIGSDDAKQPKKRKKNKREAAKRRAKQREAQSGIYPSVWAALGFQSPGGAARSKKRKRKAIAQGGDGMFVDSERSSLCSTGGNERAESAVGGAGECKENAIVRQNQYPQVGGLDAAPTSPGCTTEQVALCRGMGRGRGRTRPAWLTAGSRPLEPLEPLDRPGQ
eukprot:g967.t1